MARRAANPAAIPRWVNYVNGVFTVTTDLRAIVKAIGLARTTELAALLDADLNRQLVRKHNTQRKVAAPLDRMIAKQVHKTMRHPKLIARSA